MKVTKWLFLLTLIFFPFGELIRIPLGNDIIVKPLDISVGLTTLSYAIYLLTNKKKLKGKLYIYGLSFIGIAMLSLIYNSFSLSANEFLTSFSYLVRWVLYFGIYFVSVSFDQKFKYWVFKFLMGAGSSILLLGFVQYLWYPDLRNLYYLGWDEHLYRLFSTFLDPNFTGAFFVLFFLFVLSMFAKSINVSQKILLAILSALTILGILLTYSRSAYLMLLVSGGLFLVLQKKFKIILGLGVILIIFALASTQFASSEGTKLIRTASSISRIDSDKKAIGIITSHPVLGVGFNAYRYILQKENLQNSTKALEQHANSSPDTSLLFVLVTTGVLGLSAYLYLYITILKNAYKVFKKGNILGLYVFSCMIGFLVNSVFINSLFYPFIMLWMWVLIGLTEST